MRCFLLFVFSTFLHAATLPEADSHFERKRYQLALQGYETLLKNSSPEVRFKALYRSVECEALLFRYATGLERAFGAPLPSDPLWRLRFLLLRSEIARHFLNQYPMASPGEKEVGNSDLLRQTPEEWHQRIHELFQEIYKGRALAVKRPLSDESYFIESQGSDPKLYANLWDFFIDRAVNYYLSFSPKTPGKNRPLAKLALEPKTPLPLNSSAGRAVRWLSSGGSNPEYLETQRLLIPVHYPDRVARWKKIERGEVQMAMALEQAFRRLKRIAQKSVVGAEAAELFVRANEFARAVSLCQSVETSTNGTLGAQQCYQLRLLTITPQLTLQTRPLGPGEKTGITMAVRNLSKVHFRIVATDTDELMKLAPRNNFPGFYPLRRISDEALTVYLAKPPVENWSETISEKIPHEPLKTELKALPSLKEGVYILLASSDPRFLPKQSLVVGAPLNVSRLLLHASGGWSEKVPALPPPKEKKAEGFHLYVIDGGTGEPDQSNVQAVLRKQWNKVVEEKKATDKEGHAGFLISFAREGISWSLDALARKGLSVSWLNREISVDKYFPPPFEIRIESDRMIYRPGQTIQAKVTVLKRNEEGFELYGANGKINIELRDSNGEEVGKGEAQSNAFGSAVFSLPIPTGRLLGQYSLQAILPNEADKPSSVQSIQVEEYKRPDFEIILDKGKDAWTLGQMAEVAGKAAYLFGKPVDKAKVAYRVYRQNFYPFWCWRGGRGPIDGEKDLVQEGETVSNSEGRFRFEFRATQDDPVTDYMGRELPVRFSVEVAARDASGRTLQASQTYAAGKNPFVFEMKPSRSFGEAGKSGNSIQVRALNPNEEPVTVSAHYAVYRLSPVENAAAEDTEKQYEAAPEGEKVKEGEIVTSPSGGRIDLPALTEGLYRIKVFSTVGKAKIEEKLLFPVASDRPALPVEALSLSDKAQYSAGETAAVLLGSSRLKGKIFIQYWVGEQLLKTEMSSTGLQLLRLPLTGPLNQGVTLRWFGSYQFKERRGEIPLLVTREEKKLALQFKPKTQYFPGEKGSWDLSVKDSSGTDKLAEGILRVYDRALDYYAAPENDWRAQLYSPVVTRAPEMTSLGGVDATQLFVEPSLWQKLLHLTPPKDPPPGFSLPTLRSAKSRMAFAMNASHARMAFSGGTTEKMEMMADSVAAPARLQEGALSAKAQSTNATRQNFNETAVFLPQLEFVKGSAKASFALPDSLTSWRASVGVLTPSGQWAFQTANFSTQKDLMTRLVLPRFWREGDQSQIGVLLENMSEKALQGTILLSVKAAEKPFENDLGLTQLSKAFTVFPHQQTKLFWPVTIPSRLGEVTVQAKADAGELQDTERKSIPILPSKERLVDSQLVAVDNKTSQTLTPTKLGPSDSREQSILQVDPQLFSALLASIPQLVHSTCQSTDAVLYRWLPMRLMQSLYTTQPELKRLAEKLPKRTTPMPAWEGNDPRRQALFEETPWLSMSRGNPTETDLLDFLDAKQVDSLEKETLRQLKGYQLSNGAFPWFPGGDADPYVTLSVLAAFAEARDFGYQAPEETIKRAFDYALTEFTRRLDGKSYNVNLSLYAAYVLSSYFDTAWGVNAKAQVRNWMDLADKHVDAMTALGKAYAAWAWRRLGDASKSESLLDQAMDGTREDAVVGVYWQPEALSWLWYHDTLDKHTFLLRTLLRLRSKDPRIAGLTRWLLFHRKGNSWASPRASIGAVFALAETFRTPTGLSVSGSIRVQWLPQEETRKLEIDTVLDQPWRWLREGEVPTAKIEYKGNGLAFASLTTIFTSVNPPPPSKDRLLQLERRFLVKTAKGWLPLKEGDTIRVGDAVQVQNVVKSRSQFEYLQLRSPRGAGFESDELSSGYKWDKIVYYREPRDSKENYFFSWIPQGEFRISSHWHAVLPGDYRISSAQLQSIYAPEMAAYSPGIRIKVRE